MNADHINPFIQGAQNILNTIYNENPSLGKVFLKDLPYLSDPVAITIEIFGDLVGDVIFTMQKDAAMNIVSKLMMGMPVLAMDEMSVSAISELANMISGNVATIFSGVGKIIDISPPKYKDSPSSADFNFTVNSGKIVCIPLRFIDGTVFELDINVVEPK